MWYGYFWEKDTLTIPEELMTSRRLCLSVGCQSVKLWPSFFSWSLVELDFNSTGEDSCLLNALSKSTFFLIYSWEHSRSFLTTPVARDRQHKRTKKRTVAIQISARFYHPSFCLKYTLFLFKFSFVWKFCGFLLFLGFLLQFLPVLSAVTSSSLGHMQILHILMPWLVSWWCFMLFSKVCPEVKSLCKMQVLLKRRPKTNNRKYLLRKMKNLSYF